MIAVDNNKQLNVDEIEAASSLPPQMELQSPSAPMAAKPKSDGTPNGRNFNIKNL